MRAVVAATPLALLAATAASAEPAYLPLTRSAIVALAADTLQSKPLKAEPVTLPPEQRSGLAPGDTVWQITAAPLPVEIFLAGQGENIDALHVYYPVVNAKREEDARISALLSALFKDIYPNWPDAGNWPRTSAIASWNTSPLMSKRTPADPNDLIIRKTVDGITSATIGVPPDLFVYSVTTRAQCVPDAHRGNPFQRVVC
ncbi:MAG TPA: hypothetical protein VHZ78_00600 [Rhizomicrobium sp.]|jgi:hypothetical protein|nr:hypothetical protein [Rhizomicrobium sp.]